MNNEQKNNVDDLSYQWPANVLEYDVKFWGGLTVTNMLAAAGPFMAGMMVGQSMGNSMIGIILGALGGTVGFLITRPFEGLTNLALPVYIYRRLLARWQRPNIEMPLIMPGGDEQLIFADWDGEDLIEIRSD